MTSSLKRKKLLKRKNKHRKTAKKNKSTRHYINKVGGNPTGNVAVVVVLTSTSGFFSTFLFLCKLYIYAKENNYLFFIEHDKWQYTYKTGWNDYFKTLNIFNDNGQFISVKRFISPNTPDVPNYTISKYIDCIKEIFILHDDLQQRVDNYIKNINSEFTSIYIRRGDKVSEVELFSIDDILIQTTIKNEPRTIFVQTDDYSAFEYIKNKFPLCNVITMTKNTNRGSDNNKMLEWTSDKRKEETEELLVSCAVFVRANTAWSYYHSNVGIFHKLYNYNTHMYVDKLYTKEQVDNAFKLDNITVPYMLFP